MSIGGLRGVSACAVLVIACAAPEGVDDPGADLGVPEAGGKADDPVPAEFGLDSRPKNTTCLAPQRPPSASSVTHRRAWPNLAFTQPIALLQPPSDPNSWWLIEKRGVVWSFSADESTGRRNVVLDHRSQVEAVPNEAGLLGLAFHPDFPSDPRVFLSYTLRSQGALFSVVTSMEFGGGKLDPESEEMVLFVKQPFSNHNGGHIAFGPDGFLYIGYGDGGSANDPQGNGQNKNTRLGKLLRVDIDNTDGEPFGVPPQNPFVGKPGLDEIYAYGLRNPWRFSFDQQSGQLWLGDVGQNAFEEVDIIVKGGNYGWNKKEAFSCFAASPPCSQGLIDPVHAYSQADNNRSITGGYVYRGSGVPGLDGTYIFGDFVSGRVWGLSSNGQGGFDDELLFSSGSNISSFAQGHDGEVYFLSYGDGTIRKLVAESIPTSSFPERLSETGCFNPENPSEPMPGVIPYDINAPLWSDGAKKERFLAIPDGKRIRIESDGDWTFPTGTVLMKSFSLAGRRIETRLLVRHDDGDWAGYAYRWNASQTDATLVSGRVNLTVGGQQWTIPSRSDCMACHTAAAKFAIGPESGQLNRDGVYPSTNREANQLATLAHVGMFENPPSSPEAAHRFARTDDASESLAARARAYLHSNCSSCHRPGGPGRSNADLRHGTSFSGMNVCEATPDAGTLGVPGARILDPGRPDRSLISLRLHATDSARMPPIGSVVVDPLGTSIVDGWIESLSGCN